MSLKRLVGVTGHQGVLNWISFIGMSPEMEKSERLRMKERQKRYKMKRIREKKGMRSVKWSQSELNNRRFIKMKIDCEEHFIEKYLRIERKMINKLRQIEKTTNRKRDWRKSKSLECE